MLDVGSVMENDRNHSPEDLKCVKQLLTQIKTNFQEINEGWISLQTLAAYSVSPKVFPQSALIVQKSAFQKIQAGAKKLKYLAVTVVNQSEELSALKVRSLEAELEKIRAEKNQLQVEVQHWKSQLDTSISETQKEKQAHLNLRADIKVLTDQLSQQSEFCSSLGAATCTLLWRVSKHESNIQTIVSGSRSPEFLELIANSVQNFLMAYKEDEWPNQSNDEAVFILALCGTITNIAASALGREHLASCSQGCKIIDTFINFITEAPLGKSANMKSLMLMSLYNISINLKGMKYLTTKPHFMNTLAWHLKEEKDTENILNSLRLIQSLISDEVSAPICIHQLLESVPVGFLQHLVTSSNKDIQVLSQDILSDMRSFTTED